MATNNPFAAETHAHMNILSKKLIHLPQDELCTNRTDKIKKNVRNKT